MSTRKGSKMFIVFINCKNLSPWNGFLFLFLKKVFFLSLS
uniref:Uncharacterized protein n=1 Tax=Anguilla anguilla TaxID=7936 RepID=A0A0E9RP35_ANGAN